MCPAGSRPRSVAVRAEFYRSLLGGAVDQPDWRWALDEDWATLHSPSGPVLTFQRAADYQPPRWPDPARPQQFHLDFGVPDLDRAHEQVLALGATVLDAGVAGPKRLRGAHRAPSRPSIDVARLGRIAVTSECHLPGRS
ncbi:VOC family protein [Streptomyces nigrescens]|uniref:VOC family protein n=1 Tax=Streptomyces nigrescens TaxID=1920 RepID=UPI00346E037B